MVKVTQLEICYYYQCVRTSSSQLFSDNDSGLWLIGQSSGCCTLWVYNDLFISWLCCMLCC